jgi:hypothetical protein
MSTTTSQEEASGRVQKCGAGSLSPSTSIGEAAKTRTRGSKSSNPVSPNEVHQDFSNKSDTLKREPNQENVSPQIVEGSGQAHTDGRTAKAPIVTTERKVRDF